MLFHEASPSIAALSEGIRTYFGFNLRNGTQTMKMIFQMS